MLRVVCSIFCVLALLVGFVLRFGVSCVLFVVCCVLCVVWFVYVVVVLC